MVSTLPLIAVSGVALHQATTIHTINPFHVNMTSTSHVEPHKVNIGNHTVTPLENLVQQHTSSPPHNRWFPEPPIPKPWIDDSRAGIGR